MPDEITATNANFDGATLTREHDEAIKMLKAHIADLEKWQKQIEDALITSKTNEGPEELCRHPISQEDLDAMLRLHKRWYIDLPGGVRADLSGFDLRGKSLRKAFLKHSILSESDLMGVEMSDLSALHSAAMEKADEADLAKIHGQADIAARLYEEAFQLEAECAALVAGDLRLEPTRSVLHRSAASLALDCGKVRDAERLAAAGLAGLPPDEIAEELRDLLQRAGFHHHMVVRGRELASNELQMSLAGAAVAPGMAPSEDFIGRLGTFFVLLHRTAERKIGAPYRVSGLAPLKVRNAVTPFVSVPRAASFAVTIRFGNAEQLELPGIRQTSEVLDELLSCLEMFVSDDSDQLKRRISDQQYLFNFIGLARKIAPDGRDVNFVGLTAMGRTGARCISLDKPRSQLLDTGAFEDGSSEERDETLVGRLLQADSRSQKHGAVTLVDTDGKSHDISVPPGMMLDVVRPYFEATVTVRIRRTTSGPKRTARHSETVYRYWALTQGEQK